MAYPWTDGNIVYAADLNNKTTLTLMSGTYYIPFTANVTHTNSTPYDTLPGSETVLSYTGSGMIVEMVQYYYVHSGFMGCPPWKVTLDGTVRWSGNGILIYNNPTTENQSKILTIPFRFFSGIKIEQYGGPGTGSILSIEGGGSTVVYVKEGI